MPNRIIRAGLEELDLVCPLYSKYREFYGQEIKPEDERSFLEQRLKTEQAVIFLAIDATRPHTGAGFVLMYPVFDSVEMIATWLLHDLYVAEQSRQQGVGRQLMHTAHDFCRSTGAGRVDLATAISNTVAQPLYESMGYQRDSAFYTYSLKL